MENFNKVVKVVKRLDSKRIVISIRAFDNKENLLFEYWDRYGIKSNNIAMRLFKTLHRKNSRFYLYEDLHTAQIYKLNKLN